MILLSAEEGEARMLGVDVGRLRLCILLIGTGAVSSVVCMTGLISFVGLLAPHGARMILKNHHDLIYRTYLNIKQLYTAVI